MPRRRRHDVVAFGLAALAVGAGACQADVGDAGCQLTQQVTLAGTPLTLLQDARLDQVGNGYFLLGTDGTSVRWGAVSAAGALTHEQAYALPQDVSSAYFAVAGVEAPDDTVLVAYLGTDAASGQGGLAVIALPADGSAPAAPPSTVVTFPGGIPAASSVAMLSSRKGMNAGLAWVDDGSGQAGGSSQVMVATLDGTGALTGTPVAVSPSSGAPFSCLAFSPGKDDLTVIYYAGTTSLANNPSGWVIAEANEAGSVDSTTVLGLGRPPGSMCALVSPTATGYGITWQDTEGDWLAEFVSQAMTLSVSYPFASSAGFGGADLQPPLVGLAPFGTDFGVLLSRPSDVELWRVSDTGNRQPGALIFPSTNGTFGSVSALPPSPATAGGALVATYADYTNPPGASGRLFVNAVCQ
jgi:hypothetical protein